MRTTESPAATIGAALGTLLVAAMTMTGCALTGTAVTGSSASPVGETPPPPAASGDATATPTPTPIVAHDPGPTVPPGPGTATPPPTPPEPTAAHEPTDPEPQVVELETGGPAPEDGQLYDLAISCTNPMEIWIDDGTATDASEASWRQMICGVDTGGFIDYAVPGADARVYARIGPRERMPLVERRPHGGSFTEEQIAALGATDVLLVDVVAWCGTTTGPITVGEATAECIPNEAAVIDDVLAADALTQLTGPPGARLWVILQLQ